MKSHKMTLVFFAVVIMAVVGLVFMLAQMSTKQVIAYARADFAVGPEWMKTREAGKDYVMVDVRPAREYGRGHPEGAINLPWQAFYDANGKFLGEGIAEVAGQAGLKATDEVVLVGGSNSEEVGFVFWALEGLGQQKLHVMVNPVDELKSEGVAFVTAPSAATPGTYEGKWLGKRFADAEWMRAHGEEAGVVLVDVRQLPPSTETLLPPGIAGAKRLPISGRLWDKNSRGMRELDAYAASIRGMMPDPTSKTSIQGQFLDPKSDIVIYGENGREAATAYFVFRLMGFEKVRVFEGGWSAWEALK